jgi:hypothetical protein
MFAALAIPSQMSHAIETNGPIEPEELLAWQLGGVTQEEIRAEANTRGMVSRPEGSVMEALSWMGADAATIKAIQHASGRRPNWELGLKRQPWDVFVKVARERRQNYVDDAKGTLREAIEKQPTNAWMHFVWASMMGREEDWLSAYDESSKGVKFASQSPYIQGQYSYICSRTGLGQPAEIHAKMLALRSKDAVAHSSAGDGPGNGRPL